LQTSITVVIGNLSRRRFWAALDIGRYGSFSRDP
jgi:hypothetical protein